MQLLVNGSCIDVSQMGPDFLLVDSAINHPPDVATLVMQVDAVERRWPIRLPDGVSADSNRIAIAASE